MSIKKGDKFKYFQHANCMCGKCGGYRTVRVVWVDLERDLVHYHMLPDPSTPRDVAHIVKQTTIGRFTEIVSK